MRTHGLGKLKSSKNGYIDDDTIITLIDTNLGTHYAWSDLPMASGGSLQLKNTPPIPLRRTPSAVSQPAFWNISTEPPPGDEGDSGDSGGRSWWDWWRWWRW
jgi:hypothetical protein